MTAIDDALQQIQGATAAPSAASTLAAPAPSPIDAALQSIASPATASASAAPPGLFNPDQVARDLTFGLSDKAAAAGSALGAGARWATNDLLRSFDLPTLPTPAGEPGTLGGVYDRALADRNRQASAYQAAHPGAAIVGPIVGSLLAAPAAAEAVPMTLGKIIGGSAKAGAALGGLSGLGESDQHPFVGAGLGALAGGAVGAAIPVGLAAMQPVKEGVERLFSSPDIARQQAVRRIAQRVGQDATAGGTGPVEMWQQLAAAPTKPQTLADVGGENVRALAGSIARAPGQSREIARNLFETRDADAADRLIGDINQGLGRGESAYQTIDQLMAQRAAQAAPLYERAFSAGPVSSVRLRRFLNDPILRQGLAQGLEVQRLEALAQGTRFHPNDYSVIYPDPASAPRSVPELMGVPSFAPTPNMRTLDAAKRGLDNMIDQYRDPLTGRLNLDQRGKAINQVRAAYLNELDNLNGDYAAARQAWSGPSQAMDLIRRGQNFDGMQPEEIQKQIGAMSPNERQFFLLGAADKLRADVLKTATNADEAKRLLRNGYVQRQLRPLFDSDQSFQTFADAVGAEKRMFEARQPIMGGSATAARLAEDGGNTLPSAATAIGSAALAAAAHEPVFSAEMALRGLGRLYNRAQQPSPAVRNEMARILFSPQPATNRGLLAELMSAGTPKLVSGPASGLLLAPSASTAARVPVGLITGEYAR